MDCLQGLTNTGSNLEYPVANQEKEVASIQASVTSELSLQKNPLCKKGSSPLALILLQQRAEAVGENLAAIQSKIANEGGPRSAFDQGPVAPVSPNQTICQHSAGSLSLQSSGHIGIATDTLFK